MLEKKNRILIAPLDWGFGHFTRCIPLINELIKDKNVELTIGASNKILTFVKAEFPNLNILILPSYNIKYSNRNSQIFSIFKLIPNIFFAILKEHRILKKNIKNFDKVISDNRFGLWNKKIYSVFMTHQIKIKLPKKIKFLENFIFKINKNIIEKYNELWIPDFETNNKLSGELSEAKNLKLKIKYLGAISRFKDLKINEINNSAEKIYDIIVILSGPEPQRTIFEQIVFSQLLNSEYKALIVLGKTDFKYETVLDNRIYTKSYLNTNELFENINNSKYIISRSGYTSIMDYYVLNRTAILVPTPGQTEQEYLAEYLSNKKMFYSVEQSKFDLTKAIEMIKSMF